MHIIFFTLSKHNRMKLFVFIWQKNGGKYNFQAQNRWSYDINMMEKLKNVYNNELVLAVYGNCFVIEYANTIENRLQQSYLIFYCLIYHPSGILNTLWFTWSVLRFWWRSIEQKITYGCVFDKMTSVGN